MKSADQLADWPDLSAIIKRYPETPNWLWITVLVIGFLLIIPIFFMLLPLTIKLKINPAVTIVATVVVWLGVFMALRRFMFWRREGKVAAFVQEFNRVYPGGNVRLEALRRLKTAQDDYNEVLIQSLRRLQLSNNTRRMQSLGATRTNPVVQQISNLLTGLQRSLKISNAFYYTFCIGVPGLFLVFVGMDSPREKSLILLTLIFFFIWNVPLAFVFGFIESAIALRWAGRFNTAFSTADRNLALNAFDDVPGCKAAKKALRSALKDEEEEDDDDETESGDEAEWSSAEQMAFCTQCGQKLSSNERFCKQCGVKIG